MSILEKAALAVCLYCVWELASIPIAETGDEPLAVPLSLYQAFVFNRRMGEQS